MERSLQICSPSSFNLINPSIKNVKFHFYATKNINIEIVSQKYVRKIRDNFYTLKKKFSFIIFPKAKFVNVTGVATFSQIEDACLYFNKLFKENIHSSQVVVDNCTASGETRTLTGTSINILQLKSHLECCENHENAKLNARPDFFPGASYKRKLKPTCVLFESGNYTIVGGKSEEEIFDTYNSVCATIACASKTLTQEKKFVVNVG